MPDFVTLFLLTALAAAGVLIRRQRQQLSQHDEERSAFDEYSNDWAWEQDEQLRFTRFHGGPCRRDQMDFAPYIGRTRWDDPALVADPDALAAHRAACERREAFVDFQYGTRLEDGSTRWIVSSGHPVFDNRKRFRGYRGLAREDTVRLQAERALRCSEDRLAAIAAGSPVPMFALDAEGKVILWNRGCEVTLNLPAQQMLGRDDPWRAFYPESRAVLADCMMRDDPAAAAAELYGDRVRPSTSIPGALEAEGYFPELGEDGRWLYFVAAPMRDELGEIIGAIETLQDITARKRAETVLADSNSKLRALIDNMPGGVSLVDASLELIAWNQPFLRLLDFPPALFEAEAVPLEALVRFNAERGEYGPGDAQQQIGEVMSRAARGEAHIVERTRPDGTVLEIRGSPVAGGGFVTIYTDITARKAGEEALRLQTAYLNAVIEHLPQGISVFDDKLRLKHWNARVGEILDLPPEALRLDARFEDLIRIPAQRGEYGPGDSEAQVQARREQALRFEPHTFERTRENGKTHLVEGRPMRVDGRVAGFVTTYTDITELRASERELARQRAELESAQRTARIGSWRWAVGARLPECSPEMLRLLKADALQPVPGFRTLLRRVCPQDRHKAGTALRALITRGHDVDLLCRFGRRPQTQVHMHIIAVADRDEQDRIIGFHGTTQDVTALQQAEAALRASSAMLTTIFEQSPLPLALIRISGDSLLMANRAWHQQFVPEGEACTGRRLDEMGIWPLTSQWETLRAGLRDRDSVERFEADLVRHDGQQVTCEISGRSVTLDGEALLLASFVDVTEERRIRHEIEALNTRLEERVALRTRELTQANEHLAQAMDQLVQSEKLASLGGLVAGVAHELNTPLGNAMTVATTLRERVGEFTTLAGSGQMRRSALNDFLATCGDAAKLLERNVSRASRQVAQFKQVAVDQTSERRRRFDLHDTVGEIINTTLQPRMRHVSHTLRVEIAPDISLDSYPGPLEQVISNLVDNALYHAFDDDSAGVVRIEGQREGPDHARIIVSDNGRGMPPEVAAHAFDPFFTTRLGTGGSGLGLYIVFNLVSSVLGGRIRLESHPGAGTRFTIELPLQAPEATTGPAQSSSASSAS